MRLEVSVGRYSAQGIRDNNEDRLHVDRALGLYLVADGMGGQARGERASLLATKLIPAYLKRELDEGADPEAALAKAMIDANAEIVREGQDQPRGRRMGTTAVVAYLHGGKVYIGHLGDSRAYLIRGNGVKLLTHDHSVAYALVENGTMTEEQAKSSPFQHVLHKYLGCADLNGGPDIASFEAQPNDRLVLATDGLTNHITEDDLVSGARHFADMQQWAENLVDTALERGSRDNVTCIVLAFDPR